METDADEARRIVERVTFELENMIGNSCIDYGKLLAILKGRI